MDDCYTFREQLAIGYPSLGHALWESDPGNMYEAVDVGDVGFIRGGIFYRLFNALLPNDHRSNPNLQLSSNFLPQLQPTTSEHIRKSRDNHGYFHSKNVTKVSRAHKSDVSDSRRENQQVTFSCSGRQGALLYLPFSTERKDTVARGDFSRWMIGNIDKLMRVAEDLGSGVTDTEDIILVTGCHLARSWINVTFSKNRKGAQVSFGVRRSGDSGVDFEEGDVDGGDVKFGPRGKNLPENQCIFVRGYRAIRIPNIPPILRGLPGPLHMRRGPRPGSDQRLQLMSIPDNAEGQDPLCVLLEYIVEHARDCDMAVVYDDDLKCIDGAPLETLQPDAFMRFLRNHPPAIHLVQCELSSGRKRLPGAKAIATVATLSKVGLEEPQLGDISGYVLLQQETKIAQNEVQPPSGSVASNASDGAADARHTNASTHTSRTAVPPQAFTRSTNVPETASERNGNSKRNDEVKRKVSGLLPTWWASIFSPSRDKRGTSGERNKSRTRPDNNSQGVMTANTMAASEPSLRSRGSRLADSRTVTLLPAASTGLPATTGHRDTSGPGTASSTQSPGTQCLATVDDSKEQAHPDSKRKRGDEPCQASPRLTFKSAEPQQNNGHTRKRISRPGHSKEHMDHNSPLPPELPRAQSERSPPLVPPRSSTDPDSITVRPITSHSPPESTRLEQRSGGVEKKQPRKRLFSLF